MTDLPTSLRWFAHANVNTADVVAGERFYTEALGLTPQARTAPAEPQDGSGFAMPGVPVQWQGVLLGDHRGGRGPLVDLLQWKLPPTEGVAAGELTHLGLSALRFGVSDMERAVASSAGPVERSTHRDKGGDTEVTVVRDPDGTRIELVVTATAPVYRGVRVNCTDLERSVRFYRDAFGLDAAEPRTVDVAGAGGDAVGSFRAATVFIPGQPDGFTIELTQWIRPAPVGTPPTGSCRSPCCSPRRSTGGCGGGR